MLPLNCYSFSYSLLAIQDFVVSYSFFLIRALNNTA